MSQYTTGVNYNSSTGFYEVSSMDSSGKVSTQNVNFSTLCMMFSLDSLNAQDEVFASQFAVAEEQVSQLTMINDCMQMLNKYVHWFDPNGSDDQYITLSDNDATMWANVYYPQLVESGLVQGVEGEGSHATGTDPFFYKNEIDIFMENLQLAQSTVSSQNEQQMLLTNDAANKRSTILQQAQTLLQAAQDARNAAAKT